MKGTLYTGGTIYTLEPGVSVAEAVLVENGRIQAVGKRTELEKDAEKVVDLEGKTMLPAFIDSHSHLMGVANGMLQVDLAEASSFAEVKERIENFIRGTSTAHSAYCWSFRCTQFHGTGRIGHYG